MLRTALLSALACGALHAADPAYTWQVAQATPSATGDLTWAPQPYQFAVGAPARYIDFAGGSDDNSGESTQQAWKHHPWDAAASGKAAACKGAHTYVFKRGVTYRGSFVAAESGSAEQPISLVSDPAWGQGEALIAGSREVTGWKHGGANKETPAKDLVWTAQVDWLPRTIWVIKRENGKDGEAMRIPLARTPNWKVEGRDDIKGGWWTWTNKGIKHFGNSETVNGRKLNLACDPEHLTPAVLEHAVGATVRSEYGWVMCTPFPSNVYAIDKDKGGLVFGSQWADNAGSLIVGGNRYYLENSPAFLDDPAGEHWIERTGEHSATIHLIFPPGFTAENCRVEAGHDEILLTAETKSHLRVAGLAFRYTNAGWDVNHDGTGPAISLKGPFSDIEVANCTFADLGAAVQANVAGEQGMIDGLTVRDSDILRTDERAIGIGGGDGWGMADGPFAYVDRVSVLRNRAAWIGMRPNRFGQGHAIDISSVRNLEVAGNILDMCWGSGIFLSGAKNQESNVDVPFTRMLVHHNKVTNALLNTCDWGGIETWQGGPTYVFNNISGDIRGYWNYNYISSKGDQRNASFGHSYYLDGAFKNYHFNNIAYGRTRDGTSPFQTCSAFQEIHSYQNSFFNNSVYDIAVGSRRQAPEAGRDKFLGNIFDGLSQVFRHSDAKGVTEANAKDAGEQGARFAYDTNAYGRNLFGAVGKFGLFESDGLLRDTLDSFAAGQAQRKALATDVGKQTDTSPLPGGAKHDFTPSLAADGLGVKVFVPWALFGCVAEWNFYPSQADGSIIDEHWYMTENFAGRTTYHNQPMNPLTPKGLGPDAGVAGPLEDWVKGAVAFDGKAQYYELPNAPLEAPITYTTNNRGGPKAGQKNTHTVSGEALHNPQVRASNLLIETYLKAESDGIVVEKMDATAGYGLRITGGKAVFTLRAAGADLAVSSATALADGKWHHLLVEADRTARTLTCYLDGKRDAQSAGPAAVSLANPADLHVGGSPDGHCLRGTIDFMRICLGTLADARTTIDELHAWEFVGPQLRDFSGQEPRGAGRDAGAIEGH